MFIPRVFVERGIREINGQAAQQYYGAAVDGDLLTQEGSINRDAVHAKTRFFDDPDLAMGAARNLVNQLNTSPRLRRRTREELNKQ